MRSLQGIAVAACAALYCVSGALANAPGTVPELDCTPPCAAGETCVPAADDPTADPVCAAASGSDSDSDSVAVGDAPLDADDVDYPEAGTDEEDAAFGPPEAPADDGDDDDSPPDGVEDDKVNLPAVSPEPTPPREPEGPKDDQGSPSDPDALGSPGTEGSEDGDAPAGADYDFMTPEAGVDFDGVDDEGSAADASGPALGPLEADADPFFTGPAEADPQERSLGSGSAACGPPPDVPEYGQCGGRGHSGGTDCGIGFTCVVFDEYYSQCQRDKPAGPEVVTWGQCGGKRYNGPTTCEARSYCDAIGPYFSQCKPCF